MAALLEKSILCPVLVGRESYLNALGQRLTQVRGGQGQTLLVAGEAGIGKSRLAAETKALARQGGFTVLQGNCFEPDRVLPYAPLLDLLRAFIVNRPATEVATTLTPFAPELIKLLPELGELLPEVRPAPALEPEQEKRRLFQTLAQALTPNPLSRQEGL